MYEEEEPEATLGLPGAERKGEAGYVYGYADIVNSFSFSFRWIELKASPE